jgi:hypothetical protein
MTAQVEIFNQYKSSPVYLYTKEGVKDLVSKVYEILSMNKRWDDADYLARMIFCAMVPKDKWYEEKGFGIGTTMYQDLDLLITLDVPKQSIKIQSSSDLHGAENMSFQEFVDKFYSNASL